MGAMLAPSRPKADADDETRPRSITGVKPMPTKSDIEAVGIFWSCRCVAAGCEHHRRTGGSSGADGVSDGNDERHLRRAFDVHLPGH